MTDKTKDDDDKKKPETKNKKLSRVRSRAIRKGTDIALNPVATIAYQHVILCQTSIPYRNLGDEVRRWERKSGDAHLLINAGELKNIKTDRFEPCGLPYGPKPRLLISHINAEALKQGNPVIDIYGSMTTFVGRVLGHSPNGREIKAFKEHVARLAAARISIAGFASDGHLYQVNTQIIDMMDLWFPGDDQQSVLWPSKIHLDWRYYNSLIEHAVPLDERALGGLSHSAMALDIYAWLAQRLHRIHPGRPDFIAWARVKDQFGQGYGQMNNFKRKFRVAMRQVLNMYPEAKVGDSDRGLTLRHSKPPVLIKLWNGYKPPPKVVKATFTMNYECGGKKPDDDKPEGG